MNDDEKLINFVQQHECLYNFRNRSYKNSTHRNKLYEQIGRELGVNGEECADRWNKLRNRFSKELKFMQKKGLLTDNNPRWYLFPAMSFLSNYLATRKGRTRVENSTIDPISLASQISSSPKTETQWKPCYDELSVQSLEEIPEILPPKVSIFSPLATTQMATTSPTPSSTNSLLPRKRKWSETVEEAGTFAIVSETGHKNSNLQSFANMVSDLMEPLSKRKQLQLMQQIFTLVTTAQLEEMSTENTEY